MEEVHVSKLGPSPCGEYMNLKLNDNLLSKT